MIEYDEGRRSRKTKLREKRAARGGRRDKKRRQGKKGGRWIDDTEKMDRKNGRRREARERGASLVVRARMRRRRIREIYDAATAGCVCFMPLSIPSLLLAHFPSLSLALLRGFALALV